jgi:hypothetical protein
VHRKLTAAINAVSLLVYRRVGPKESVMNRKLLCVAAICSATIAAPALAGEIKGPPPSTNYTAPEIDIHARSFCAFSGLNDSPLGDPSQDDPGGITQSFGSFVASRGASVPDLDPKTTFAMPGFGCNPNRGVDLHGGG